MVNDNSPAVVKVPLTKVTLYKHGIGYFERRAKVNGPAQVELQCGPYEIDDMLKSLLVLKKGADKISAVTYESSKPLSERLGEFGFDLKSVQGFTELIGQLKGTPLAVTVLSSNGNGKNHSSRIEGKVLGLDSSQRAVERNILVERFLVILGSDNVIKRIEFSDIESIEVKDETLAAELQQQLELLFLSVKKKDRKLLKFDLPKNDESELMIAYSIPCPIWKTSYRLMFDAEERLLVQGVAIVDNVQEEDWTDVQMVLVSSAPVSFIQPLYEPIMPSRRTIGVQGVRSTGPFVAERAQKMAPPGGGGWGQEGSIDTLAKRKGGVAGAPPAPPAPAAAPMQAQASSLMGRMVRQRSEHFDQAITGSHAALSESMADMAGQLDLETAEKGELFEYKISGPVTVPRNSSALIPVVQEFIEGERLSLYSEARNPEFPYATVRLKNTTGLTLESGPVTVMEDDAYAGECLLDVLKPDDTRFLPYALDQSVRVLARREHERKPVWRVQVLDCYLHLHHKEISKKTYHIENLSAKRKVVYIEHPVEQGWNLIDTEKPEETTASFYRFKVELEKKQDYHLTVSQERVVSTQYYLIGMDPDGYYLRWLFEQNYTDDRFVAFMKEVRRLNREIFKLQDEEDGMNNRLRQYEQEQERARQNVKTLGGEGVRFKQVIEDSEDRIVETQKKIHELQEQIRMKNEELHLVLQTKIDSEVVAAKPS